MAASAPSFSAASAFSGVPTVQNTRAPSALATWMAITPIPDVPPCTSSVSPSARRPRSTTLAQTVKAVSGSEAACAMEKPAGTGSTCPAGAVTYSA